MSIDKSIDKLYNEFKKTVSDIEANAKILEKKDNNMGVYSELLDNISNVCSVTNNTYVPCSVTEDLDDYYNYAKESKFITKTIPEQLENKKYDNIYINKTFNDGKTCRVRGSNQHINLDHKQVGNKIGIDSDGYCIFRGTNIG